MIKLIDILNSNQYALYHDTRYGVVEQAFSRELSHSRYTNPDYNAADMLSDAWDWIVDNRHIILDVIEVAAAIAIPFPAGLIISSAIGLAHAGLYIQEGEEEEAGLYILFAMLPGVPAAARKIAPATMKTISEYLKTGNKKVLDAIDKISRTAAEALFAQVGKLGKDGVAKLIMQKTRDAMLKNAPKIAADMVSSSEFTSIINKIPSLASKIMSASQKVLETAIKSTLKTGYTITKLGFGGIAVYNIAEMYHHMYDQHIRIGDTEEEYMKKLEALDNFTQSDLGSTAEYLATKKLGTAEIARLTDSISKNW